MWRVRDLVVTLLAVAASTALAPTPGSTTSVAPPIRARAQRTIAVDAAVTGTSVLHRGEHPACPGADAHAALDEQFDAPRLGPSSLHADLCGIDRPEEGSTEFNGTFRIATRSGALVGELICSCDRPGGPFAMLVTGGTHRFRNARGTLSLTLSPWFSAQDAGRISGTVSFAKS
jgi:hypothetical protein